MSMDLSNLGVGFIYKGEGKLEKVTIFSGEVVDAVQFNYSDGSIFTVGGCGGDSFLKDGGSSQMGSLHDNKISSMRGKLSADGTLTYLEINSGSHKIYGGTYRATDTDKSWDDLNTNLVGVSYIPTKYGDAYVISGINFIFG